MCDVVVEFYEMKFQVNFANLIINTCKILVKNISKIRLWYIVSISS